MHASDLSHDSEPQDALAPARGLVLATPVALLLWAFIAAALFVFGVL